MGTPRAAYLQYRDEDRGTGSVGVVTVTNHSTGRSCFTAAFGQCPRLEHGMARHSWERAFNRWDPLTHREKGIFYPVPSTSRRFTLRVAKLELVMNLVLRRCWQLCSNATLILQSSALACFRCCLGFCIWAARTHLKRILAQRDTVPDGQVAGSSCFTQRQKTRANWQSLEF